MNQASFFTAKLITFEYLRLLAFKQTATQSRIVDALVKMHESTMYQKKWELKLEFWFYDKKFGFSS